MSENAPVAMVGTSGAGAATETAERATVSGRRRAAKQKRAVRRPVLAALVAGALACGGAWFFMVRAAIDFGRLARDGQGVAWAFTGAATVGATACLLLMFILVTRILMALGLVSDYKPRRASGRRAKVS